MSWEDTPSTIPPALKMQGFGKHWTFLWYGWEGLRSRQGSFLRLYLGCG